MKKRITSLLLVLAVCFAMLPTAAFAVENTQEPQEPQETQDAETWGDKAVTSWYDENETVFHITTAEQLAGIAKLVNEGTVTFEGKTVYLDNNLDLAGIEWISIGTGRGGLSNDKPYCFCGIFDGQGYVISNLYSRDSYLDTDNDRNLYRTGLFGNVNGGEIKNLGILDADISIDPNDKSAAGEAILVDFLVKGKITNCWTTGKIASGSYLEKNIGGIVGVTLRECTISGCYSTATLTGNYTNSSGYYSDPLDANDTLGGIVGMRFDGNLIVTDCWFGGKIIVNSVQAAVGGIVGFASPNVTVQNCLVTTDDIGRDPITEDVNTCWLAYLWQGGNVENNYWPNDDKYAATSVDSVNTNAGTAVSDFTSEDVLTGLNTNAAEGIEWVAGIKHPTFAWDDNNILANYDAVNAAIEATKELDKTRYSNYNTVEDAINAVNWEKSKAEQSEVDAMAKAIEDAIAGLVRRSSSSGGSSKTTYPVNTPTADNGTAAVSPKNAAKGDTVTITVTPDSGYEVDKVTVTDANGNTITVTDKCNGKYTFTMPAGKVTITPTFVKTAEQPTGKTFVDVAKSDWFADAVAYVTENGLMNGTGSDTFSPNASTTRGMLMTVLARYAGADTTGSTPWYQAGMDWTKANGVSDGTNPTVNITREQLVTMLYRYAGSPAANGSLDNFSDAANVSDYAVDAMQWAVANGIVNGSNGKLNPKNNATRAEVAAILMRFCKMGK